MRRSILTTHQVALVSLSTVVVALVSSYIVPLAYAQPIVEYTRTASNAVAVSTSTQVRRSGLAVMREIHVANNGLMLVRGAHVVSIDGTTIRAALGWGATNFAWDVQTDATTLYFDATGKRMTYTDLQIGDIITISGMLVPSESQSIIQAQYVREQE